ncbi:ribosomal protein S6 kinase alpha-4-like [Zootermopsis nevadensis]|uniref:Ribosomal protein S6 kinase alpha-4 n=1 Tax=Zootermopsis nevadensis TaxID=136037 RepID=A0A067R6M4_ZOONE|nr:ribosomal protein S6 kinase alpha-4-like [Zootermopsis nevadensis]KDR13930.1 Ribosomal protein S6 kinase alpha-4 [Zootermopsis nevadensis]
MASTSKQNEEEIPKCVTLKDFKMGGSIRKVGYAEVFLVRKRGGCDDRKYYAMKRIDTSDNDYKKIEQSVMTEIQVGQKVLGATFFVGLHYVFWSESHVNLVMEYMGGLDMLYLLTKRKNLLERHARFYLAEVLLAIEALHEMGIVHRNINPHNILLDSVGHIGLVNFGSCKQFQPHEEKERNRAFRETLEYMAPEIIKSEGHDMAVDWWSFGILAYDMIVGLTPFERNGGISEDWMYQ